MFHTAVPELAQAQQHIMMNQPNLCVIMLCLLTLPKEHASQHDKNYGAYYVIVCHTVLPELGQAQSAQHDTQQRRAGLSYCVA